MTSTPSPSAHSSLRLRLSGVGLLCMLLATLPSGLLLVQYNGSLNTVTAERSALPANRAWQRALAAEQKHRELAALALNRQGETGTRRNEAARQVLSYLDDVTRTLQQCDADPRRIAELNEVRAAFMGMVDQLAQHKLDAAHLLEVSSAIAQTARLSMGHLNADKQLLLDSEARVYFAVVAGLQDSPALADALSVLSTLANSAAIDDVGAMSAAVARYQEHAANLHHHLTRAAEAAGSDGEALRSALERLQPQRKMVAETVRAAALDVNYPLPKMAAAFADAGRVQAELSETVLLQIEQLMENRSSQLARQRALVLGLVPLLLAGVAVLLWRIMRGILESVMLTVSTTERIASGDLSASVPQGRRDELGRVLVAVATMQARLRSLLADIQLAAGAMSLTAQEIAEGNRDLQQRTMQTASHLNAAASRVDSLGNTVRNSAAAAHQANGLATEAASAATKGGLAVDRVVETIGEIHEASGRITNIIGVIDGIAFQTNILALNAAVEAARAGEQGRGFAVVAAEVRSLAMRSADAAREIKVLIAGSVERVELGTRMAREAGHSMQQIVESVGMVSGMIAGIADDAEHQASSMDEVVQAVASIDEMSQSNAALVDQSAQASDTVQRQAERMSQLVETFKIGS